MFLFVLVLFPMLQAEKRKHRRLKVDLSVVLELNKTMKTLKKTTADLQNKNERLERNVLQLNDTVTALQDKNERLEKDVSQLNGTITSLQDVSQLNKNERLEKDVSQLNGTITSLQDKNEGLERDVTLVNKVKDRNSSNEANKDLRQHVLQLNSQFRYLEGMHRGLRR